MYNSLLSDCKELMAILVTIIKKLKANPKLSPFTCQLSTINWI